MRGYFLILSIWCCAHIWAQRHIVFDNGIASLQVVAGVKWQEMPVITIDSFDRINIDFDDMSHSYRRLTYSIIHLDADFTESEGLFSSDYISGFSDGLTIDDYEQSINTIQNYTHYHLQIPNRECRIIMSGNYRLDVRDDDNSGELLASVFFMVNENLANVFIESNPDTDVDVRKNHQQVTLKVDYSKLNATNPNEQIKVYVLQNYRWDNAVMLPPAKRINQHYMEWIHCKDLIFDAGNEYHKFEILDVHRNSMNVENNVWDGEQWHTHLWEDYNRTSYVYDETPKGAFYIRNSDNIENNTSSEYVNVHFYLKTSRQSLPVYVNAMWTNDMFNEKYLMEYNEHNKRYEAVIPLKYGYYSYQYLSVDENGNAFIPKSEGSFYETRNIYNALIYFRGNTDRADRLVGFK